MTITRSRLPVVSHLSALPFPGAGMFSPWRVLAGCVVLIPPLVGGWAQAHGSAAVLPHRLPAYEVRGELPPPPPGVATIKFGEFYRMPVGPLGLEPSEKLLALNGKRVRLVGYMVKEDAPVAGRFMLSPLPVTVGDDDESLADDLPPSTVFVRLAAPGPVPYLPALLHLTGTLEVGAREEGDGRVSAVRLVLDPQTSKRILGAKPMLRASTR